MLELKNRLIGIDFLRLIAAFLIMILHTSLGSISLKNQEDLRLISRWAVPFFFITSGFFLGKKIEINNVLTFETIQKNLIKFFSIFIIANIIYLPIAILKNYNIFIVENLILGDFSHLWFIGSLIYGYLIIWYFYYLKKTSILSFLSIIIIIISFLENGYFIFIDMSKNDYLFRFLLSIPFLHIGIIISKLNFKLLFNYKYLFFILVILGFFVQYIESIFLKFNKDRFNQELLVGTLIISISLFLFVLCLKLKDNLISKYGREYSLFIYIYHPLVYVIMSYFVNVFFNENINFFLQFFPIIGFILTLLFGIILNKYFKNIFKILNGIFY